MADTHDAAAARATELAGRRIAAGLTGLVLGILLAVLVAYAVWQALGGLRGAAPPPQAPHRLESAPQPSRQAYFAEKQRWLDSYGWVDRAHGIARMPVEAAMREIAASAAEASAPSTYQGGQP